MRRLLATAAAIAALQGCATFNRAHVNAFVDDDGRVLRVEYGTRSRPYTYYIVSPINGNKLECHDDKMVKIELPDGDGYTCYISQNVVSKGTMYSTRDEKIKFLTTGLQSRVYKYVPERNDYLEIFDGQLSPQAVK